MTIASKGITVLCVPQKHWMLAFSAILCAVSASINFGTYDSSAKTYHMSFVIWQAILPSRMSLEQLRKQTWHDFNYSLRIIYLHTVYLLCNIYRLSSWGGGRWYARAISQYERSRRHQIIASCHCHEPAGWICLFLDGRRSGPACRLAAEEDHCKLLRGRWRRKKVRGEGMGEWGKAAATLQATTSSF